MMPEQTTPVETSNVLVVEDNPGQRETLCDILELEGFKTLACGSATEADEVIGQQPLAVAILDLRLPDRPGTHVLERLRADDDRVQVIIHTGYGSFASAKDSVNYGAFAYLEKPTDPEELVRQVHRAAEQWMRLALRQSEERYRLLEAALEQALLPVAVTSADVENPRFVYVNPAFAKMTGYPEEELLGQSPTILHGLKTARATVEQMNAALRQGRSFVGDLINYRKDGSTFAIEWRLDPVRDGEGTITHWVAIFR